jgi:hypothetical protein
MRMLQPCDHFPDIEADHPWDENATTLWHFSQSHTQIAASPLMVSWKTKVLTQVLRGVQNLTLQYQHRFWLTLDKLYSETQMDRTSYKLWLVWAYTISAGFQRWNPSEIDTCGAYPSLKRCNLHRVSQCVQQVTEYHNVLFSKSLNITVCSSATHWVSQCVVQQIAECNEIAL